MAGRRFEAVQYVRKIFDGCTDCDVCRFLMEDSCLLFPRLYELYDRYLQTGDFPEDKEFLNLVDCCTLCGLCPCPDVRTNILWAKAEKAREVGLNPASRLLSDLQVLQKLGSAGRLLLSLLLKAPLCNGALEMLGICSERRIPSPAVEDFFSWARKKGLKEHSETGPRVAYFVGCTAAYIFPEVARAAVKVLESLGVFVHIPDQNCCGMPLAVEGDKKRMMDRVNRNIQALLTLADKGYEIVCSCPTCGYFFKAILKENACFSVDCDDDDAVVRRSFSEVLSLPLRGASSTGNRRAYAPYYFSDDFFQTLDVEARLRISALVKDVGEYLVRFKDAILSGSLKPPAGRWVYFAPCHQREQGMGKPYYEILSKIPGFSVEPVGSTTDCCGMGGSLGFKKDFNGLSLKLGLPLMEKIKKLNPAGIITDCLSCRLQFQNSLPYPVLHPLELLAEAMIIF
ncbi:heterodisulfide reductase-related iron-sulfur binding cluster [Thermodesulforhabdus norvegica]|uniref:Glycerol-3-phosphate dehydrogenase subunit C n=1 Tax=Thermodesulforhabdus norvegica TaxID=39841 RepID=A0A1I4TSR1_9BACT|nr:heterodisulfide reductase-related iron-sulfur binding cluster [Thermodesulforhabdus norvegica]SFM79764.1 glycerol-3-phosphate dehydrogenase subunit C [Thermodesulforhabdus norvegica]